MGKEERMGELYPTCLINTNAACTLSRIPKGQYAQHATASSARLPFLRTLLPGQDRALELLQLELCLMGVCEGCLYCNMNALEQEYSSCY